MQTLAVILERPETLPLSRLDLTPMGAGDVAVAIDWSGISTGTERLLWTGRMPMFPGMGYPLVPGYESVGHVTAVANDVDGLKVGDKVFVPGAKCYGDVRGLFGGAASNVVVPANRVIALGEAGAAMEEDEAVLFALAATAYHAIAGAPDGRLPGLIVGHGVLGRLLARITVALGGAPVVWETNPARRLGADGYAVVDPAEDSRRDYASIQDVSGDPKLLDTLISRLAPQGEVVLAGFYEAPLSFSFPPAFMREARIRIAAEWKPADIAAVKQLVESGRLKLDGLITHRRAATDADDAYRTAFNDPSCLKMVLDWRAMQ